ncbi:MAG TPA: hypothetical protein PLR25_28840 [Planctomycetaceae bacterium]|nr:hypothetical protein [Planctomycetaceae bacterium]
MQTFYHKLQAEWQAEIAFQATQFENEFSTTTTVEVANTKTAGCRNNLLLNAAAKDSIEVLRNLRRWTRIEMQIPFDWQMKCPSERSNLLQRKRAPFPKWTNDESVADL